MANLPSYVQPGDLITAARWNEMVDWLKSMDGRLTRLEDLIAKDKQFIITDISPKGKLPLGTEVSLSGKNFAFPLVLNTVSLDEIPISVFNPGSNDGLLKFNIPLTITGIPKSAELLVKNKNGQDSMILDLVEKAPIKPTGVVVFSEAAANANLGEIKPGEKYTWMFAIDSQTNVAEDYQVSAIFSESAGVSDNSWLAAASLVDAEGKVLEKTSIPAKIDPSKPLAVGIQLVVPGNAISVNMKLQAKSVNNDAELTRSYTVPITVGAAPTFNDPRVTFTPLPFGGASKGRFGADGAIEIPFGGNALVRVQASFKDDPLTGKKVEGDFEYSLAIEGGQAGAWSPGTLASESGSPHKAAGAVETLSTRLVLNLAADPGGNKEEATLVITAKRVSGETFTSFARLAIRGYTPA